MGISQKREKKKRFHVEIAMEWDASGMGVEKLTHSPLDPLINLVGWGHEISM